MRVKCARCWAETDATRADPCPACGEPLTDAEEVAIRLPCSHCGAPVDATAGVECAVCGTPVDLAAIAAREAADAQALALKMAADAEALNAALDATPAPAEESDPVTEALAQAQRIAEEAEAMARAAAAMAPHSRLSCRHCGAFVDPTASPQCPVCLESTGDAIPVPWTPPEEPDEDREAAPMQVSAIKVPEAIAEAAPKPSEPVAQQDTPRTQRRESPLRVDRPSGSRPVLTAAAIVPPVDAPPRAIAPVRAMASAMRAPAPAEPALETPQEEPRISTGLILLFILVATLSFGAGAVTVLIVRH